MQLTKPKLTTSITLPGFGAKKTAAVTGLSIEGGSIALAQPGGIDSVAASAVRPLPPAVFHEGEVVDQHGLSAALKEAFGEVATSRRVRVGIANQRVVVRTLRLPVIADPKQMEAAIRFQAQEHIPMPLDQAVLQHQIVATYPPTESGGPQVDVVVVAARRDMVMSFLEPLRRAGLETVGIDLSAFAMIRALARDDADLTGEAILYCNVGDVLNLAVARGRTCLFTRVSGTGIEAIAARLASECGMTPEHAEQWLLYVGLERPEEELEGDPEVVAATRRTIRSGTMALVEELRLSLDYYRALDNAAQVSSLSLCGVGSAIPGIAAALEAEIGLPISIARPRPLAALDEPSAARLVLPLGLALES
ncbi:MAG: pilus assembly protein PilM [Actinobacteria bacterium]|nr:pilus assembly protein PilM [Actinomycetota bacterium]